MPFYTIDVAGRPWLVCEAPNTNEPKEVARKSGHSAGVNVRPATDGEKAILKVERLLAEKEGRDPDKVFGVRL
ncbi:MAG TPA: hypothetical protein VJ762_09645 [Sphingobium sp.]|nr:hypothetical protein [Sphingobium sp.]